VLLVSALMIVPVAIAQLTVRSFRGTMTTAMIVGAAVCVMGLSITYFHRLSPGATIVALAIGVYAVARPLFARSLLARPHARTVRNRKRATFTGGCAWCRRLRIGTTRR
jgi:zinc transport system permease protein